MIGMDVEAVRRTASELRRKAGELRAVEARVDAIVGQINGSWQGNRTRQFVGDWHGRHRAALLLLADRVDGLGQSALNNAREQENASRGGSGSRGRGVAGNTVSGANGLFSGWTPGDLLQFGGGLIGAVGLTAQAAEWLFWRFGTTPLTRETFGEMFEGRYVGKLGNGVLGFVSFGFEAFDAYNGSAAQTDAGRVLTSVLGGGTAVVFGLAAWPVALADELTGGHVQNQLTTGMESIVVGVEGLITGDSRGVERLSEEMRSGQRGIFAQGLSVVGEQAIAGPLYVAGEGAHQMYSAITTGDTSGLDLLSDQILAGDHGPFVQWGGQAGDVLGDALYDSYVVGSQLVDDGRSMVAAGSETVGHALDRAGEFVGKGVHDASRAVEQLKTVNPRTWFH